VEGVGVGVRVERGWGVAVLRAKVEVVGAGLHLPLVQPKVQGALRHSPPLQTSMLFPVHFVVPELEQDKGLVVGTRVGVLVGERVGAELHLPLVQP
jgi:hypothetical protein